MKAYVDFLGTTTQNHIIGWGLGGRLDDSADREVKRDFSSRKAPLPLCSTVAYCNYAHIVSETAKVLGRSEEAEKYARLAETIRAAD